MMITPPSQRLSGPATRTYSFGPSQPRFGSSAAVRSKVRTKAVVDFFIALALFVLALPVIAAVTVLIRTTSRGPAFYSQTRVGLGGRLFRIYKLRTMYHNCEAVSGVKWAAARDPRVTWLGGILRRLHLDELPQLVNVLKGEMSLVGPRPERPEFVSSLRRDIPGYEDRLHVRPGVTGLAQVQLPADTCLDSVRRKLVYDLYYIDHMSLSLDLRLICSTAMKMCHLPFGISRWLLCIPSTGIVESQPDRAPAAIACQPASL